MADISDLLKNIMTKVYGKDVRKSIHDAIKQCYSDGKAGAIDLTARNRINNIIANANSTDGNSELVDSRIGADGTKYPTVGEAIRDQTKMQWDMARALAESDGINTSAFSLGAVNDRTGEIASSTTEIVSNAFKRFDGAFFSIISAYRSTYKIKSTTYYRSDNSLMSTDSNWGSVGYNWANSRDDTYERMSIKRTDGKKITLDEIANVINTNVPELKTFVKIWKVKDELEKLRTDYEGNTYDSAGESIKAQLKEVITAEREMKTHMDSARKRLVENNADMSFFQYGSINSSGKIESSKKELVSVLYDRQAGEWITAPSGYEIRISVFYTSNGNLWRLGDWSQGSSQYAAANSSIKDRVSIRRTDGGDIDPAELEGIFSTSISALRAFYNLRKEFESQEKYIDSKVDNVKEDIKTLRADMNSMPNDLLNAYVWEKKSESENAVLGDAKALSLGSWMKGVAGLKPDFTINYSDGVTKIGSKITLADPVKSYSVTDSQAYKKLTFLRGKFVEKPSGSDGCFLVSTDATFSNVVEKNTVEFYVMKCSSAQHVDDMKRESFGHVAGASRSAYPSPGVMSGYWYEYKGTIGEALTKLADMSND